MKVLVIGGTRFVGLRLVRALAREGHDVTLLNRGRTQAQLPAGLKRLTADRRNAQQVKEALKGQEFEAAFDITGYQVVNLEPMVEVLGGRIGHYVFQSTCGVYADTELLPVLEDSPLRQRVPGLSGLAAYEFEKAECEGYLMKAYREKGFPATIFRCPVIYGPENWMDDREGSFFYRLLQGRKVLVPGGGLTVLQMAYVDDVARAHISVVGKKSTFGQAYNIASAQAITINGYLDTIAQVIGKEVHKVYLEPREVRGLKRAVFPFSGDRSLFYGIQKAKDDFGFWPHFDYREGLEQTLQWWLKERGPEKVVFSPGRLGNDVDLAYEDELLKRLA